MEFVCPGYLSLIVSKNEYELLNWPLLLSKTFKDYYHQVFLQKHFHVILKEKLHGLTISNAQNWTSNIVLPPVFNISRNSFFSNLMIFLKFSSTALQFPRFHVHESGLQFLRFSKTVGAPGELNRMERKKWRKNGVEKNVALLLPLQLVLLRTIIEQFLVDFHEEFQCVIYQPVNRSETHKQSNINTICLIFLYRRNVNDGRIKIQSSRVTTYSKGVGKKYFVTIVRCIRTENFPSREIGAWEKVRYNGG